MYLMRRLFGNRAGKLPSELKASNGFLSNFKPHDDLYVYLGVGRSATDEQIRQSYRARAKILHPDLNENDKAAEQAFQIVTEAYAVLSDPILRKHYDRWLQRQGDEAKPLPPWLSPTGILARSATFTLLVLGTLAIFIGYQAEKQSLSTVAVPAKTEVTLYHDAEVQSEAAVPAPESVNDPSSYDSLSQQQVSAASDVVAEKTDHVSATESEIGTIVEASDVATGVVVRLADETKNSEQAKQLAPKEEVLAIEEETVESQHSVNVGIIPGQQETRAIPTSANKIALPRPSDINVQQTKLALANVKVDGERANDSASAIIPDARNDGEVIVEIEETATKPDIAVPQTDATINQEPQPSSLASKTTHRYEESAAHQQTAHLDPSLQTPKPPIATQMLSNADSLRLVKDIQRELKRLKCYRGRIDGQWGIASDRAVRKWRKVAKKDDGAQLENATVPGDILLSSLKQEQNRCNVLKRSDRKHVVKRPVRKKQQDMNMDQELDDPLSGLAKGIGKIIGVGGIGY